MKKYFTAFFVGALTLFSWNLMRADSNPDSISIGAQVHFKKPAGWDVVVGDEGSVLLKPLGVSGVRTLKLWLYPPKPDPNFSTSFNDQIEPSLWLSVWGNPTFWAMEPLSENGQNYVSAATSQVFIRGTEWSFTRHFGKDVHDICNFYTFINGGVIVATYTSSAANVTESDAQYQSQDVQTVLEGISND